MTDKEKIRAEVERLKEETSIGLSEHENGVEQGRMEIINALSAFLDSMQEEPKFKVGDVIQKKDDNSIRYSIINRADDTYRALRGLSETIVIWFSEQDQWELVKELESEGKDIFDNCLKSEEKFILPQKISGNIDCENCLYSSACALGDIQACIVDKPVSEGINSELDTYIKANFTIEKDVLEKWDLEEKDYMYTMDKGDMLRMVKHFVNLQKQKDSKAIIDTESVAFANGMAQMRQQMMKDALDGEVIEEQVGRTGRELRLSAYIPYELGFKDGDKVKLIIIKEE